MKTALLLFSLLLLTACSQLRDLPHLAAGQWQLLHERQAVPDLLADPAQPAALKARLREAALARDFASRRLALPDNGSYRSYVELGRPYVVWNLFASPEFSLQPLTHCFPLAGCVAYRGYFAPGRARGAAALLRQEGWDTAVVGIEAYSTLGWFDDPLLSSMLRRSDAELVGLIFHELAHQQFYLPGDTAFNESFARFVELEGLRQWREQRGLPAADGRLERQREQFTALLLASRGRLEALYAQTLPAPAMRQAKQAEFARLRHDYRQLRDQQWQGDRRFDAWINAPLNNARLLPVGLYEQWLQAFARLFAQSDGDWPRFYQAVEALAQQPDAVREQQLRDSLAVQP